VDPQLTASAEGSPRPADGVRSGHEKSGSISAQGGVDPSRISVPVARKSRRRYAHVLEDPRPGIRARGKESFAEEKFSPRLSSRNVRSLRKDLHEVWQDCSGKDVGMKEMVVLGFWESEGGGLV
jgi:hypothetical protein